MMRRRDFIALAAGTALPGTAFGAWNKGDAVTLPPLTLLDGRLLDQVTLKGKVGGTAVLGLLVPVLRQAEPAYRGAVSRTSFQGPRGAGDLDRQDQKSGCGLSQVARLYLPRGNAKSRI